jgi:5'-methylthioadenosine phosphorylase
MAANGVIARSMIRALVAALPAQRTPSPIDTALNGAILTAPDRCDPALAAQNSAILARLNG